MRTPSLPSLPSSASREPSASLLECPRSVWGVSGQGSRLKTPLQVGAVVLQVGLESREVAR